MWRLDVNFQCPSLGATYLILPFHLGDGPQSMLGVIVTALREVEMGCRACWEVGRWRWATEHAGGDRDCVKGGGDGPQSMLGAYLDSIKGGGKAFSL